MSVSPGSVPKLTLYEVMSDSGSSQPQHQFTARYVALVFTSMSSLQYMHVLELPKKVSNTSPVSGGVQSTLKAGVV